MIAKKKNPALWKRAKEKACEDAGLCLHSARKMQWATRYYKKMGGRYEGRKRSDNRLRRWTQQRWRTHSGKPSRGRRRYLPDRAWARLSPAQIARTNRSKRDSQRRGRQYSAQPPDVVAALRGHR